MLGLKACSCALNCERCFVLVLEVSGLRLGFWGSGVRASGFGFGAWDVGSYAWGMRQGAGPFELSSVGRRQ